MDILSVIVLQVENMRKITLVILAQIPCSHVKPVWEHLLLKEQGVQNFACTYCRRAIHTVQSDFLPVTFPSCYIRDFIGPVCS